MPHPLLPATALASDHCGHGDGWTALKATITILSVGNYYLFDDVTYPGTGLIYVSGTVTLCLNGKVLDLGGR